MSERKLDNLTDALVEDILKAPDEEVLLEALAERFSELRDKLTTAETALALALSERDEAVRWIGVVGEEFVNAGFQAGDRTVTLDNVRQALAALALARAALEMIAINAPTPEQHWSGGAMLDVAGVARQALAALGTVRT